MKKLLLLALLLLLAPKGAHAEIRETTAALNATWIDESSVEIEVLTLDDASSAALRLLDAPIGAQLTEIGPKRYRLDLLAGLNAGDVRFGIATDGVEIEKAHRIEPLRRRAAEAEIEILQDGGNAPEGLARATRSIRIHGALSYIGVDGFVRYADAARIEVVDEDGIGDAVLYDGSTNSDGSFDFSFDWDDGDPFDPQPDLRLRFYAENDYAKILYNDLFNYVYAWEFNLGNDFTGTDIAIWPRIESSDAGALHANGVYARAGRYFENDLGYAIPTVDVKWPTDGDNSHYNRPPKTGIQIKGRAIWWESTLLHEYGHHFNQVFSGFPMGGGYCNGICDSDERCGHCAWCPETESYTWTEGYASFISYIGLLELNNYIPRPYSRDSWEYIAACGDDDSMGTIGPPNMVEGFTTSMLRDLVDDNNENDRGIDDAFRDESTMSIADVLRITTDYDPHSPQDMIDELEALARYDPGYPSDEIHRFWATARNNGWEIDDDLPVNPTSIVSTSHTPGVSSPLSLVSFSWSGMSDATSGIAGYAVELTPDAAVPPSTSTLNIGPTQTYTTGAPVAPGTYWFTLRAFDRAGHSATDHVTVGPIVVGSPEPVNLTQWTPEFWTGTLAITQTPGNVTPLLPETLRSDVDTWMHWAFANPTLGSAVVDPFRVYVKGYQSSIAPTYDPGVLQAGAQFSHHHNFGTVPGGRHTFTLRLDTADDVGEQDETDNRFKGQWVFEPEDFAPPGDYERIYREFETYFGGDGTDQAITPIYPECTGFRVTSDGWWNAYVVYPRDWWDDDPGDPELFLYDTLSTGPNDGFETYVERSIEPAGETEAIFVNRNLAGYREWDLGISNRSRYGGSRSGYLHHVRSELISFNDETSVTLRPYPRFILREFEVVDADTGPFTARVTVPPGTPELRIAILDDDTTITSLSDALTVASTDSNGVAVLDLTIEDPGHHCLVVWGPPDGTALYRAAGDVVASIYVGDVLPDMTPMPDGQGWAKAMVPRPTADGNSGSVPLPEILLGDVASTYINTRLVNLQPAPVPFVSTSVLVDGNTFTSFGFGPLNPYHVLPFNDPTARTIPAGRHTLGVFTDFASNLAESDEQNNTFAWQWAWSPPTMPAETPTLRNASAAAYGGTESIPQTLVEGPDTGDDGGPGLIQDPVIWPNCDGMRAAHTDLGADGKWWGAAIQPTAGLDLTLNLHEASDDPQLGFTETRITSDFGGIDEIEFVLVNHNFTPHRDFDLGVVNKGDSTDLYRGLSTASTFLDSVPDGTYGSYLLGQDKLLQLHEVWLEPGQWTVELTGLDGFADLGLSVHRPFGPDGTPYHARSNAEGTTATAWLEPSGAPEVLTLDVDYGEAGSYCVAVWRPRFDGQLQAESYELEFTLAAAEAQYIVVDGVVDPIYGAPVFTQTVQTAFGDNTDPTIDLANGSELDGVYAKIHEGMLYMLFAGNLESNFNRLEVFLDTQPGGQNRLRGDNPVLDENGLNRMGDEGNGDGLTFDPGFEPDHYFTMTCGGEDYAAAAEYGELLTGGGGIGHTLGRTLPGPYGTLVGVGSENPFGIRMSLDNSNVGGVTGGTGSASGAGVVTGVEWAIPLTAIGDPPGCIRVSAFVNGQFHDFVSNQVAGALAVGTDNLGDPRNVDFGALIGDQFVEVCSSTATGVEPPVDVSRRLELHPALPNPFNPRTTLSFTLPFEADVELTIYDVAGRLVTRLIDGRHHTVGRHSVSWDGRDQRGATVSSGTYLYRIRAGGFTQARRMTLLK